MTFSRTFKDFLPENLWTTPKNKKKKYNDKDSWKKTLKKSTV